MKNLTAYLVAAGLLAIVVFFFIFPVGDNSKKPMTGHETIPESLGDNGGQPHEKAGGQKNSVPVEVAEDSVEDTVGAPDDIWSRRQFTGDYPAMVKRRMIRALVPPSKTFFFLDKGQKRGLIYDGLMGFEKYINRQLKSKHLQVKVVVIPTSRKRLISDLEAGYGDIAAGNLTITERRKEHVDFAMPALTGVDEIIVTGADIAPPGNIFELAGRVIYVRKTSSYYDSLLELNSTLTSLGKKPVTLVAADEYLEDEDLLEMVNAGLIPMIVIDSHKGKFWEKIFKNIRLQPQLKLRSGGKIAWAVRKDTPELLNMVNGFTRENKKGTLTGNILFRRYLENTGYVKNNLNSADRKRYDQTIALFKQYADKYDFPYLLLTALAYQESRLDNSKRSRAGAIGIMQVLPATALDKNVGISKIEVLENNIHAGVKYMYFMKNRYFSGKELDELNSDLFTIAAYNAGPARIAKLRKEAKERGFDPNIWFNNVEVIAARRIGRETVRYVGNIYKYYVAYKHIVRQEEKKEVGKSILQQHYMEQE